MHIVIITTKGSTKIVNVMTPGARVLVIPLYSKANWWYSNDDQGRVYENCKLNAPRISYSCARVWLYAIHWKYLISFSTYSQATIRQIKGIAIVMMNQGRVRQNYKLNDSFFFVFGAWPSNRSHIVQMHYFFSSSYLRLDMDQKNYVYYVVMVTKEKSTIGQGFLC